MFGNILRVHNNIIIYLTVVRACYIRNVPKLIIGHLAVCIYRYTLYAHIYVCIIWDRSGFARGSLPIQWQSLPRARENFWPISERRNPQRVVGGVYASLYRGDHYYYYYSSSGAAAAAAAAATAANVIGAHNNTVIVVGVYTTVHNIGYSPTCTVGRGRGSRGMRANVVHGHFAEFRLACRHFAHLPTDYR